MFTLDTFQKFGRDGADAALRSLTVVSGGFQAAATETLDFAKRSFEQGTATAERLSGMRSLDAVMKVQTEYARSSYEGLVAQTGKMGQLAASVAREAYAPVEGLFAKAPAA